MPVSIVPYEQAPRCQLVLTLPSEILYTSTEADFPPLSSTGGASTQISGLIGVRWRDIVLGTETSDELVHEEVSLNSGKTPATMHNFLDFPREVRDIIWDMAMCGETQVVARPYSYHFTDQVQLRKFRTTDATIAPFLPTVCHLSRDTRMEAIHVFLRSSRFFICSYRENQYLSAFLSLHDGYRSVRGLHFEFFDYFSSRLGQQSDTNADLELCVLSTGLRELCLRLHNRRLDREVRQTQYGEKWRYFPVPVQDIWDFYKLDRLTSCRSLTKVTILRKGCASAAGNQTAAELVARIKDEFLAVGRHVDVEAIYA
ncbi:hypothetical protein N0V95_009142 [Ascochyta clinopodiicola]|nr:hypothetical protein N0V95_009142 [Ascochyta clinopodiicola]